MTRDLTAIVFCALAACSIAAANDSAAWWNPGWNLRTTVTRPTPYRDDAPRPVEVAVDFPLLMERAGIDGQFDPASLRVIEREPKQAGRQVPFAYRSEFNAPEGRQQTYLAWMAGPKVGEVGGYDIYFAPKDRGIEADGYDADVLPVDNLLTNPGFEEDAEGLPAAWTVSGGELVSLDRFDHTTGQRSLKIQVDENTPEDTERGVSIRQKIDVRKFAGQEMVFECDLLAERAAYGAPVSIKLEQFRADGSPILECAVQPRWLSIELAQGQLVQFCERGRFSPEAVSVDVIISMRCWVEDADTGETVTGPESLFTVWLDRVVVRPGERWPWPAASNAGFVEGPLDKAPLNRGFEFTGRRRLAFNAASEGALTAGKYDPNPKALHWGIEAGTLEFWCRPSWDADDGVEHVLFHGSGYRGLQSRMRKLNADGNNELEFTTTDVARRAGERHGPFPTLERKARTVRGPAPLQAGRWYHIAATWDFPKAHLQLFVDGKLVASEGPGAEPWPSSLEPEDAENIKKIGFTNDDKRSIPGQAFIGGDSSWGEGRSAEAALDEFRVSDVVRYAGEFTPSREEFPVDEHTRILFHLENECHGVHDGDDRFVRGYLACELEPQEEKAPLEVLDNGKIQQRMALVKPYGSAELFEANWAENRLPMERPVLEVPDPRFAEYRERQVVRTVTGADDDFTVQVGGDLEPLMGSVTFERAEGADEQTTLLPRWRANDNVVPFSAESLAATLAPDATSEAERAFEAFKYALGGTRYFDAGYCETLPGGLHRPRVSYTLLKALNIYPFDQCGPLNHTMRKLFLAVGISSNQFSGTAHSFQQCFYDGSWRLYDLSPRMYWLNRDNTTAASLRGLGEDPYLKLLGGQTINHYLPAKKSGAARYDSTRYHNMDFALRPGERASICWHNEDRWFEVKGEDREPIRLEDIPPSFGNGAIVYEPTEGEATELDNLVLEAASDGTCVLRARDPARPASLIYRAQGPYIFSDGLVTGAYDAQEAAAVILSLSFDEGESWTEVWRSPEKAGEIFANVRDHVTARYAYWLKVELAPATAATVSGLRVRTTLVDSPLALPGRLSLGENRISFVGGPPAVPVRTTCRWVERYYSDLGVSLNSTSYYMNNDEVHRDLFIVAPGEELPVSVTLQGRRVRGEVSLERLPAGWASDPERRSVEATDPAQPWSAEFALRVPEADQGDVKAFQVVVRDGDNERRVPAQVLIADAPLLREAEGADEISGQVAASEVVEVSGARAMSFSGDGQLGFDFAAPRAGKYALWVHARRELGHSSRMMIGLDEGEVRSVRAATTLGFDYWAGWTNLGIAHTKTVKHYGDFYGYWTWFRIGDLQVGAGTHRLTLGAGAGMHLDALVLLPQTDVMDRAAMNLFQNWDYAPWDNPL